MELFGIFFAAFLINNILLIRFISLCSFFGITNNIKASFGMGVAVMFVMVMATAISKKDGFNLSNSGRYSRTNATTKFFSIIRPLILILSR